MNTNSVCSVNYIDHVGVAVQDIQAALEAVPAGVRHPAGPGTRAGRPGGAGDADPVGRFIQPLHRGEGLHHLAFNVSGLPDKLKLLEQQGLQLVDREPREGLSGNIAFVHPRSVVGILTELVESTF